MKKPAESPRREAELPRREPASMSDKRRLAGELAIGTEREGGGRSRAWVTSSSGSAGRVQPQAFRFS